jgi:hypothetical protein
MKMVMMFIIFLGLFIFNNEIFFIKMIIIKKVYIQKGEKK